MTGNGVREVNGVPLEMDSLKNRLNYCLALAPTWIQTSRKKSTAHRFTGDRPEGRRHAQELRPFKIALLKRQSEAMGVSCPKWRRFSLATRCRPRKCWICRAMRELRV